MKVSKRSLIVSIAVLCVCALSLSAASFAWFTNSKAAKIDTLNMYVEARSSLQIRVPGGEWKSILDANDFIAAGTYHTSATLNDASTNNMTDWTIAEFDPNTLKHNFKTGARAITATQATGEYLQLTVEFRATDNKDVIVSNGQLNVTNGKTSLAPALRMGFNGSIYATDSAAEATYQPADGSAEKAVTLNNTLANAKIAELSTDGGDGYFYSPATKICVWIEGSDKACVDGNTPATVTTMLQFGQAA